MPLYEYQCEKCEKVHELMQKFSDSPLESCPDCQGKVSKLMSRTSFALKGSGWYTTDYKRSSPGTSSSSNVASSPAAGCDAGACGAGSDTPCSN
ncbi:zinc ribbon domain-containing protein [bacterium]|nr:zinc ribbon domain-containing protein [bacterium]